jgi:hypothetical protein
MWVCDHKLYSTILIITNEILFSPQIHPGLVALDKP